MGNSLAVKEEDLVEATESLLRGDVAAATAAAASVVAVAATGHPLLGVGAKALVEAAAKIFADKNTQKLLKAGQEHDESVAATRDLGLALRSELSPLAVETRERFEALDAAQQLQFARIVTEMQRWGSAGDQVARMLSTMESIQASLSAVAERLTSPTDAVAVGSNGKADLWLLVTELVPRLRNQLRLADDLCVKSEYYLGWSVEDSDQLERQVRSIAEAVADYRAAWFEVDERKHVFRRVLTGLERIGFESPSLKELLRLLNTAGDMTFGFPEQPSASTHERYARLTRDWRRMRAALKSLLDRSRDLLRSADADLLTLRLPWLFSAGSPAILDASCKLLDQYEDACIELEQGIGEFVDSRFESLEEFRKIAWSLAPRIEKWNAGYVAVQNESLLLRLGLSLENLPRHLVLRKRIEAVEVFQWHDVRPALNGLLVDVILAIYNDVSTEHLDDIRRQQREGWTSLKKLLQQSPAGQSI